MAEEAELPSDTPAPPPASPPPPPPVPDGPKSVQAVLDRYQAEAELPDSSFDAERDGAPELKPAKTDEPAADTAPARARNDKGQFVPKPEAPATHTHTAHRTQLALSFGMTAEQVAATPPAELREMLDDFKYLAQIRNRDAGQPHQPPPVQTPTATQAAAEDAIDWGKDEETGRALTEKDWHPVQAADKKALHGLRQENRALQARLERLEQHAAGQASQQAHGEIDQAFADLGEAYEHIFGKGHAGTMKQDDPRFQLRLRVLDSLRADYPHGLPANASHRQIVGQRAQALFGHLAGQPAPKAKPRPSGRISDEDWENAATLPPTQRAGSPEPKGTARAVKAVAEKRQEWARNGKVGESPEEQDLPG